MFKTLLVRDSWENVSVRPDLILTDPPYGLTAYRWDVAPNFNRLLDWCFNATSGKPVVMFGCQPMSSAVVQAMAKRFRYSLIWEKNKATGHLQCRHRPMRAHEDILVGYDSKMKVYNPQMSEGTAYKGTERNPNAGNGIYGNTGKHRNDNTGTRYPRSVLRFNSRQRDRIHGTQKPIALLRYLIRTYSEPGDLVFDPFGGSGSTGIAAMLEGRRSAICENNPDQWEATQAWIESVNSGEESGT